MAFTFDERLVDETYIIEMSGKDDTLDDAALLTKFDEITAGGHSAVLLNVGKIEVLHSHALGLVISFSQTLQSQGCKFAICCVSQRIQYLFNITRTADLFQIYKTMDDALQGFTNQ